MPTDRRVLIPVAVRRCSCCRRNDRCVRFPIVFGPYETTADLCETCLGVGSAAFTVSTTLELEDAIRRRALRDGSAS